MHTVYSLLMIAEYYKMLIVSSDGIWRQLIFLLACCFVFMNYTKGLRHHKFDFDSEIEWEVSVIMRRIDGSFTSASDQRQRTVLTGHIKVAYLVLIVPQTDIMAKGVVIFKENLSYIVSLRFALYVLVVRTDPNKFYFIYFQCQGFSSHPREPCISWMCKWKTGFTTTDVWHAIGTQERPDKAIVPASLCQVRETS